MKDPTRNSWVKDFDEYLKIDPHSNPTPKKLSQQVCEKISRQLHPEPWKVFTKVAGIHGVVSIITLLFCPQFGFSLTSGMGLMHYLMKYGDAVCMLGCGAFFTSFSLFFASVILRPEEVRVLKEKTLYFMLSIASLSLGAFICLGSQIIWALALVWILGSIVGGAVTLDLGWKVRQYSYEGIG